MDIYMNRKIHIEKVHIHIYIYIYITFTVTVITMYCYMVGRGWYIGLQFFVQEHMPTSMYNIFGGTLQAAKSTSSVQAPSN